MNLDRKGKLKTYSVKTGVFESVLPKYKNLIGINKTKKEFKNSYALCDLKADSNKKDHSNLIQSVAAMKKKKKLRL